MRRRDLALLTVWACAVAALLAPALARPGFVPLNFGDLYLYHHPLRSLAASTLQAGRLPFWNPYIFGGLPLAANPQSVLFYPASLLGFLFPQAAALSWDFAFHWLWGAAGAVLLARRHGLSTWAAALFSALFALSPFLVYRIVEGIPTLLAALSWVPWCWLAWSSGRAEALAAVWALQFLSGHPQFLLANALGMGLWALGADRRGFGALALGGAGALALAAVQWLPTWEFLSRSARTGWPREFMLSYSLEWKRLLCWAFPWAWGSPLDGSFAGPPSVFFETCAMSLGAVGLALAAAGLRRGGPRPPLLAAAGLFLALGGNNPAYRWLLSWGPAGFLRTPSRWALLCLWGLVLAAGAAARRLSAAGPAARPWRAALLAAVLLELGLWDARFLGGEEARALAPNREIAAAAGARAFRILTDPELANPNKTLLYRARNANGYEAFFLAGFPAFAAASEGAPAVDSSRSYLSRHDSPGMSRFGVAYGLDARGGLRANPRALPLAYFVDDAGRPLASSLALELPRAEAWRARGVVPRGAARLVAAEAFFPGWRAWRDGRPARLESHDGLLMSVPLAGTAAGEPVEIDLRFSPTLWPLWAGLSALGWGLWLAGSARLAGRAA